MTSHNGEELRGYHKPIMLAGGIGNIRGEHVQKGEITVGAKLIVLGGPAMNIGTGGGAAFDGIRPVRCGSRFCLCTAR